MFPRKIGFGGGSVGIPYIDPNVERVGVSRLRQMSKRTLKSDLEDKTLVIGENNKNLAVLVGYEQYLTMQNRLQAMMETLEVLSDSDELKLLLSGMSDVVEGRTRPLEDIRKSLGHRSAAKRG